MKKTVAEPNAELLSEEDVHRDVVVLTELLERRRAERRAYDVLEQKDVKEMINRLISEGTCKNEQDAIERGLKTLLSEQANE